MSEHAGFPSAPSPRSWIQIKDRNRSHSTLYGDIRGGDDVATGAMAVDVAGSVYTLPRRPYGALSFLVDRGPVTATEPETTPPYQTGAADRSVNTLVPNFRFSSPLREYIWVQKERRSVGRRWSDALARLRERGAMEEAVAEKVERILAAEREEGVDLDQAVVLDSLLTLECFLREFRVTRPPKVAITPRANLRASWRDASGRVVGIEFLPRNAVAYVVLDVAGNQVPEPTYGSAGWPKMRRMLSALDAAKLLSS